ncbi:MAG: hypothetical protein NDI84_03150 [Steroidobacteraceae bacterium]|nr:hypothetical protein [Steroidobacteraceae bacterium]
MKVFIFFIGTPTPVFETELEMIRRHERLGDSVRVLQCSGSLAACHWNPVHDNLHCAACRSRFRRGWEVLGPGSNVELRQFPPPSGEEPAPVAFDSVEDLKRWQHDGENIGYGVASSLISYFRDHRFDTRAHATEVSRQLRAAVHVYDTLQREFAAFEPDLVYFFNGRIATHLPAYLLCRKLGIEFRSYEVAGKGDSYRLLTNKTVHSPLSLEEAAQLRSNWREEHRASAESVVRQRRLGKHLAKIPVFTAEQVRGLLPPGFDGAARNIAVFNSTIDEYAGVEGCTNRIYDGDETAALGAVLAAFEPDARFVFHLRVHPHMKEVASTTSQLVDIRRLAARFANLRVIWPHDEIDSYALLDACEKTLTFGSTIGMEATYWGKPSILAGPAFYENLDCVYRPRTHDELVALLRADDLPARPAESALMYFHWEVSDGVPFTWFKETGLRNGLASGTFDGVEIKADRLPALGCELSRLMRGAAGVLARPSTALVKLKQYAKTVR